MSNRRYPLSRKRPRLIPPVRKRRQTPEIFCGPIHDHLHGCPDYAVYDLLREIDLPITTPLASSIQPHQVVKLVEAISKKEGLDYQISSFYDGEGLRLRIRRPAFRTARISPKLAAFFGWTPKPSLEAGR